MTEAEWLAGADVLEMFRHLKAGERRRFSLLTCGAVRLHWNDLCEDTSRVSVEAAERWADDPDSVPPTGTRVLVWLPRGSFQFDPTFRLSASDVECRHVLMALRDMTTWFLNGPGQEGELRRLRGEQAALIRCIFGNPFRPVTADSCWLTPTVLAIAEGIYADRAFDRLPVLADALEDAGCENSDILAHCRGPGPHARGCWVVDLVLGKE